jgi:hypothetical protein
MLRPPNTRFPRVAADSACAASMQSQSQSKFKSTFVDSRTADVERRERSRRTHG